MLAVARNVTRVPSSASIAPVVCVEDPSRVYSGLSRRIESIVADLVDGIDASGSIEFASDFAIHVPYRAMCRFLGLPIGDVPSMRPPTLAANPSPVPRKCTG